jgi:CheY-like chemotaxis protein
MNKRLKCIMLIDDNQDDNFFHERVIKRNHAADVVVAKQSGIEAIDYLKSKKDNDLHPNLIFLDINMPGMNGWEFLEEYNKLEEKYKSQAIVIMLTTSDNPDDKMKAKAMNIASDFKTKPLTQEILEEVFTKYFKS